MESSWIPNSIASTKTRFTSLPEECLYEIISFFTLIGFVKESHNDLYIQLKLVCKEWLEFFTSEMFCFVFKKWPNKTPLSVGGLTCPYLSFSSFQSLDVFAIKILCLRNAESLDFSMFPNLLRLKLENIQCFDKPLLLPPNLVELRLLFPPNTTIDLANKEFTCPESLTLFELDYGREHPENEICTLQGIHLNKNLAKVVMPCDFYRLNIDSLTSLKGVCLLQRWTTMLYTPVANFQTLTHCSQLQSLSAKCNSIPYLHQLGTLVSVTHVIFETVSCKFDVDNFPSLRTIEILPCSCAEASKTRLIENAKKCVRETNVQEILLYQKRDNQFQLLHSITKNTQLN